MHSILTSNFVYVGGQTCRQTTSFILFFLVMLGYNSVSVANADNFTGNMVKMCLFYPAPSGHARADPIISQTCPSDHVHTFYGPQNFHPNTTYDDLRATGSAYSTAPFVENQSLYWHPSVYEVTQSQSGEKTYTRVSQLETSPYYRWDNSVLPRTEEFPPGFRMIAYSNQQNANAGGETGGNMFVECCNMVNGEEECTNTVGAIEFPTQACDFVGFAFAMPTCWNGNLGIDNDHINHMAYTVDGSVAGDCPSGYDRRLPQIQLFVRISPYKGGTYVLSDESDVFHVDFMNGWKQGTLQKIIDECPIENDPDAGYNPPCNCDEFLTENVQLAETPVCDNDVRNYILNEATDVVSELPRGTCTGPSIIDKSWSVDPPFNCNSPPTAPTPPTPTPPTPTPPTPTPPTPTSDLCSVIDVLGQTLFIPGAGACWRLQLAAGGTLEGDFSDSSCSKNESDWQSTNGVFSIFDSVSLSANTAVFIAGTNGYSGTFQFKEDSAVTQPMLKVLGWNPTLKEFVLEAAIPTCSADAICPTMKVDL